MSPLHLAVIGAGLIGQKHIELVAAREDCHLTAICDENPVAREIAARCNAPFYLDAPAMLAAQKPDGAIIAATNARGGSSDVVNRGALAIRSESWSTLAV
jgi:predicted dehydrogenase